MADFELGFAKVSGPRKRKRLGAAPQSLRARGFDAGYRYMNRQSRRHRCGESWSSDRRYLMAQLIATDRVARHGSEYQRVEFAAGYTDGALKAFRVRCGRKSTPRGPRRRR